MACKADSLYVKKTTERLCAAEFFGRGYVNDGMGRAAAFIAAEMSAAGLAMKQQAFTYPVNYFPGNMVLAVNGRLLTPGRDYLAGAYSQPCKSSGALEKVDSSTFINRENRVVLTRASAKLTWTVSTEAAGYTELQLDSSVATPLSYQCDVDAVVDKKFRANNIIGTVRGRSKPDSIIVFTAHYDHLGGMGKDVFFPGANDNAAGVAMLLDLAKWYAANPPAYTVMFIAFAGEEAGLLGSKYFTEHPLARLTDIRFLINLDLIGTGDEGMTVVNATEFPAEFHALQQLNEPAHLISNIYSRGKAANSDHYWFTEKGVAAFFIYTMGKRKDYHDINDVAATLPLYEVNDLEQLLKLFVRYLSGETR